MIHKTLVAKANKFKNICREKPTLVVFQKILNQTYLQSPKASIKVRWLLNFQYHKIRLSVGFNVNLLTLNKITNTYVGGEVIRVNKKGENYGIYSCFEVPVANKGNLTLRLFSLVAGPAENIMIGGGLAYRIYKK